MSRPEGKNWKLIGSVGVDSGQLMVCDPCYIDSQWVHGTKAPGHPAIVLTDKGKAKFPSNKDWSWRFNFETDLRYDSPQESLDGLCVNEAIEQGLATELAQPKISEFSYRGACSTSNSNEKAGIMNFRLGHAGIAASFRSGYGDGCYEVWARTNEEDYIVEVRIIMD